MTGTANQLSPCLRALLFSLLHCLGVRIILPDLLDTLAALAILGVMPAFFACLLMGRVLDGLSLKKKWVVPVIAAAFSLTLLVVISPPPASLIFMSLGGAVILFLLEGKKSLANCLAGIILALLIFVPTSGKRIEGPRLILIGIDSMDYVVTSDLLDSGQIPHTRNLIERGAFGPFETEEPSISPIVWTTISTGRGEEVHGVGGFYSTSDHVRAPRLWDILETEGYRIGMYRWLVTWPPREDVDGFWIPDILGRDNQTVPPEYAVINDVRDLVKGEMIRAESGVSSGEIANHAWSMLKLGIRGSTLISLGMTAFGNLPGLFNDSVFRYLFMRRIEMEVNCDLFLRLLHRYQPDFAAFYDNSVDIVGHRFWTVNDPDWAAVTAVRAKDYSGAIPLIYTWTDNIIGRLVEEISPVAHVAIASDHGQMAIEGGAEDYWVILGDRLIRDLELDTEVYVTTPGLFSLVFPVESEKSDLVGEIVSRQLHRIRLAEEDIPLLSVLIDTTSSVPYLQLNDADLTGKEEVLLDGEPVPLTRYVKKYYSKTGAHDRFGVVILSGPGVIPGSTIPHATLRDFVPTILHWEGLPVARDMDGEVALHIFDSERDIRYIETYMKDTVEKRHRKVDVDNEVKQKLKALGYVN